MSTVIGIVVVICIAGWIIFGTNFWNKIRRLTGYNTTASSIDDKLKYLDKNIGETEAICPNCQKALKEYPSQESKCSHCEKTIYPRKRPYDKQDILVGENQLEDIREQWAIINGEHKEFIKRKKKRKKIANSIKSKTGKEPPSKEVETKLIDEEAKEYKEQGNWGLARNKKKELADYLYKEGRFEEALKAFCEVCYLDANGPRNIGDSGEDAFSVEVAFISPGIIQKVARLTKQLNLELETLEEIYLQTANETYERLKDAKPPQKPSDAWKELRDLLT